MERESGVRSFWKILRDLSGGRSGQQLKRVTFVFVPAYIRDSGENPEFMKVRRDPWDLVDTISGRDLDASGIYHSLSFLFPVNNATEAGTKEKRPRRTAQGIHRRMAETESQGGGGAEEIEGPYSNAFHLCLSFFSFITLDMEIPCGPLQAFMYLLSVLLCVLGEASQAQDHSCGRREEIGPEKEGRRRTSSTRNR